jgi:dienelactone hydrolase
LIVAAAVVWLWRTVSPPRQHFNVPRGALAQAEVGEAISQPGEFIGQAVALTSSTGLAVNLRVLRPEGNSEKLPLVIVLGGHRTGRDAVDVLGHPGRMAVAALGYPYHGPERVRGWRQVLRSIPAIQQGLLDTPPAVSLALDWLIAQPWVDPSRVELMGVSLGVPFVAVAGAKDDRFKRVWLVHGALNNRDWLANRLESRIHHPAVRDMAAGVLLGMAHGASFNTGEWVARISPRPVIIVGARDDEQMTRESVEELYAAARTPKELQWSEGGHVRPHRTDIVRQLLAMVRERILTEEPPAR